ncbi:MAG: hypothetical protein JSU61_07810 [Fidelibacterota bacterium]|nr:MAG: hypothetical protein JSU61_07810 [Candidatus Neomarinimicrobiota bacterium]
MMVNYKHNIVKIVPHLNNSATDMKGEGIMTNLASYGWPTWAEFKRSLASAVFGLVLLLTGLALGSSLASLNERYSSTHAARDLRTYSVTWGSHSYDEAVWRTVQRIAALEELLPPEVQQFQVEARGTQHPYPVIRLSFPRTALDSLKAGVLPPEVFMREYVAYNQTYHRDPSRNLAVIDY